MIKGAARQYPLRRTRIMRGWSRHSCPRKDGAVMPDTLTEYHVTEVNPSQIKTHETQALVWLGFKDKPYAKSMLWEVGRFGSFPTVGATVRV